MIPKFRAFLKDTKKIADVDAIFFENEVAKVTDNEFYQFEDIILMQSTGLHDENSVEVFEGDIVEYLDGEFSYKGVVTQDSVTCWWIKGIEPDDNFRFDDVTDYTYHTCDLVVKGNIYENPELLDCKLKEE